MLIVTGANGFIGSNLALELAREHEVLPVDRIPQNGGRDYLRGSSVLPWVDLEQFPKWLERSASGVHGLFHLGACSDTTVSDREFVMRVNFEYTRTLWLWCARKGVPFVYASSAATYGDGSNGYDDTADPRALKPLNLYGESKQRFDLWALEQKEAPPRWAGLKYFNVYGPRETHKGRMASVAYHAYQQILKDGGVRLFKSHKDGIPDGGQRRDFVYVDDAVHATRFFGRTPASVTAPNGLYNVGTGKARTFLDLSTAVFSALSLKPNLEYIPMPEDLRGKYQYFTQAQTVKSKGAGVPYPFQSIEDGARKYVNYLRKTKEQE